ncbi:hypothetical protein L2E82_02773 [Cichorium intybus]|uniref:Uncharacterized protein n=1 Tax=Cichorium intybus TaxID=13427 RepID=A0ACB9H472_CICIN|nr:hypothetical protein L2E82_02773 [Cichorium intybus]
MRREEGIKRERETNWDERCANHREETSHSHHLCWLMSCGKISASPFEHRRIGGSRRRDKTGPPSPEETGGLQSSETKETLERSVVVGFRGWVGLCGPELLVSPEKEKASRCVVSSGLMNTAGLDRSSKLEVVHVFY